MFDKNFLQYDNLIVNLSSYCKNNNTVKNNIQ